MLKVLLTGSSGFIGQALMRRLISLGYQIIEFSSKDGDIADKEAIGRLDMSGVSHVFHLAAKTFVPDSWKNPGEFYRVNTNGTLQVLELCKKYNIGLTFISAYLYGIPECLPICEEHIIKPNNPYAHSKYLAEELCAYYAKEFAVKVNIIRPFNVYGIGQRENFLIPHIIKQAILNEKIIVKDIIPKRDYIYIDDLLDALLLISQCKEGFAIYNIGSGYSVSVGEVVEIIQQILSTQKEVISEGVVRYNEIDNVIADISKAKHELKWSPKYSIYSGLEAMIKSAKEIYSDREKYSDQ